MAPIVLEKTGKYVKGNISITGGSVGLVRRQEDRPRQEPRVKLNRRVSIAREAVVSNLKAAIQEKHNEVIGYNEQLKEQGHPANAGRHHQPADELRVLPPE